MVFGSVPSSGRPALETTVVHFRELVERVADTCGTSWLVSLDRDSRRQVDVDPDGALVQLGQEFAAQSRHEGQADGQRRDGRDDDQPAQL